MFGSVIACHVDPCVWSAVARWSCADPEGGGVQGVPTPTEKSQKYRFSKQYWSGSAVKPQS